MAAFSIDVHTDTLQPWPPSYSALLSSLPSLQLIHTNHCLKVQGTGLRLLELVVNLAMHHRVCLSLGHVITPRQCYSKQACNSYKRSCAQQEWSPRITKFGYFLRHHTARCSD